MDVEVGPASRRDGDLRHALLFLAALAVVIAVVAVGYPRFVGWLTPRPEGPIAFLSDEQAIRLHDELKGLQSDTRAARLAHFVENHALDIGPIDIDPDQLWTSVALHASAVGQAREKARILAMVVGWAALSFLFLRTAYTPLDALLAMVFTIVLPYLLVKSLWRFTSPTQYWLEEDQPVNLTPKAMLLMVAAAVVIAGAFLFAVTIILR